MDNFGKEGKSASRDGYFLARNLRAATGLKSGLESSVGSRKNTLCHKSSATLALGFVVFFRGISFFFAVFLSFWGEFSKMRCQYGVGKCFLLPSLTCFMVVSGMPKNRSNPGSDNPVFSMTDLICS